MAEVQIPSIDYTSRDFLAIFNDMRKNIPFFTPDWTDHNDSDIGIVLLKLMAGAADVLHFYVDRAAGEAFLPTAVKRESVVKLLKLIDFELRSIVSASVDVVFSLETPLPGNLLIPEKTRVQTFAEAGQSPVLFETTQDLVIPAGQVEGTVSVIEGESDIEPLGQSSGEEFQKFEADTLIMVEGSIELFVNEGVGFELWDEVDSFVNSGPTDKHYKIQRDEDEKVTFLFGDNLTGKIPNTGADIEARFRKITGDRGNVFGNVGASTITVIVDTITFLGGPVTLSVDNPEQASGGEDRQSIEEAKRLGPASLKALGRAVNASDYQFFIEQFGGISKGIAIQGKSSDPCCACALEVYIAPTGGGVASQALKDDLLALLDGKKMVGTCIEIKDANFVSVEVSGTVFLLSNFDDTAVQEAVNQAIDDFFDLEGANAGFGEDLFLGNLYAALNGVDGVDHVDLSKVTRKPVVSLDVWSGDATVSDPIPGAGAKNETFTVTFISPTTFSVQGSISGSLANGTIDTLYSIPQVEFSVVSGTIPPSIGDRFTFTTSTFLGNIPLGATEIMEKGAVSLTFVVLTNTTGSARC